MCTSPMVCSEYDDDGFYHDGLSLHSEWFSKNTSAKSKGRPKNKKKTSGGGAQLKVNLQELITK